MIVLQNIDGIKFFMNFISSGCKFPYIDTDIRKLIWYYVKLPYILTLSLRDDILVNLNINY